ncbi:DUF5959 family protein [Embleya sp. NPDC001921]
MDTHNRRMVELLRIGNARQVVAVRVLPTPVVEEPTWRSFTATVSVSSDWFDIETDTNVDLVDDDTDTDTDALDSWESILDLLAQWWASDAATDVSFDWPPMGPTGYLRVSRTGRDGLLSIRVCDGPRTGIGVHVPLDPAPNWIEENRALLAAARTTLARRMSPPTDGAAKP